MDNRIRSCKDLTSTPAVSGEKLVPPGDVEVGHGGDAVVGGVGLIHTDGSTKSSTTTSVAPLMLSLLLLSQLHTPLQSQ